MKKNKKIIIGISIIVLIIVIGIVIAYKLIENKVTNRENFKFEIEETYSNLVDTVSYEKNESEPVGKFSLVFYQKTMIKPKQKEVIISKGEIKDLDYNVYAYEGHIAVNLNSDNLELTENSISLRDALLQGKITMEKIIEKADKDFPNAISYDDGGSKEYHYENYTIIKCNNLFDGNRDVYIGRKGMTLNDVMK